MKLFNLKAVLTGVISMHVYVLVVWELAEKNKNRMLNSDLCRNSKVNNNFVLNFCLLGAVHLRNQHFLKFIIL